MLKEEYEIDPNSSFNKLKMLQRALKEDNAYKETFLRNKEFVLRKIETQCMNYYNKKIKIQEMYDKEQIKIKGVSDITEDVQYVLVENAQAELSQCLDPLTKLMFSFRNSNQILLDFIKLVEPSSYDDLANFLCHFFYEDIFNVNKEGGAFLLLIYLLLDEEIDKIKDLSDNNFLDHENCFLSKILGSLCRREEVKKYLSEVLSEVIIDIEGLYNNRTCIINPSEQKKQDFFSLEPNKIRQYVKDTFKTKCKNRVSDYKHFLNEGLSVCNVFNLLNKSARKKQVKEKCSMFYEEEIINPIEVILFGKSSENFEEEDTEENFETIDQFVNKYLEGGTSRKESKDIPGLSHEYPEINKKYLEDKIKVEKSENLKEYYKRQLDKMGGDNNIYTNNKLLNELTGKDSNEKCILVYQYTAESVKRYIDKLFSAFLFNKDSTPNIIKYICVMIDKLLSIKFPKISTIEKNAFLSEFLFGTLILPLLLNPGTNGIFYSFRNDKSNVNELTKILKKFFKGYFFNASLPNESYLTSFNSYFMELMPCLLTLLESLRRIELPPFIEKLLTKKKQRISLKEEDIEYDYLKENPKEDFEFQSVCISWKDIWFFYDTIKQKENQLIKNQNTMFYKTYNKISYHENTFLKKIADNKEQKKKSYIILSQSRYIDTLKLKLFPKKETHSFESGDESMKAYEAEKYVLNRVKYSISIIISHLNPLSRANFFVEDNTESTESFVKGLNKMIELEGFAEILKDQTIPLSWFGIYLESNIENIPYTHKRGNYSYLYQELLDESENRLKKDKDQEVIYHMFKKINVAENFTNILDSSLKLMKRIKINFDIIRIIHTAKTPINMKVLNNGENFEGISIEAASKPTPSVPKVLFLLKKSPEKLCPTILEFVEYFPNISEQISDTDVLSCEKNSKIPNTLENYFSIVFENIKGEGYLKGYGMEDLLEIKMSIDNYIHRRLYRKLYPEMANKDDIDLFRNCFLHSWIKIENFNEKFKYYDRNILDLAIQTIKQMDFAKSPFDKLKCFAKASEILKNYLLLNEGSVDEDLLSKLQLYVLMNATLNRLSSNQIYIEMFMTADQKSDIFLKLLQKLEDTINSIKNLKYDSFVGISKTEYEDKINKMQAGGD
ncbi:MAG: hypothetical protein MJ252_03695 [archaeon]|nr:hypothetical protein [archaeon]